MLCLQLVQLLLKSSQDKRFVCEAAEKTLITMTTWISPSLLLPKLQPYLKHKNPRIRAKASMCFCRSVPRLVSYCLFLLFCFISMAPCLQCYKKISSLFIPSLTSFIYHPTKLKSIMACFGKSICFLFLTFLISSKNFHKKNRLLIHHLRA